MVQTELSIKALLKKYFNISKDKDDEDATIENVVSSIDFQGAQLWILIFAIFIASLGLNVNSTAVIIGAMLVSPLMGPIIGMGLGVGISDLELLKRAAKNYAVAVLISVLTATLYFSITPLHEAQSELLARTSPTLYDVFIALMGGAAGFIALSTKGKSNVIPGVAIATALMPPLCTAGYGLAMGNLSFFFGAFYLFFINTVFICLATFIGTRLFRFQHTAIVDVERMKKVKRYIVWVGILTMLPATYMTVQIIKESIAKNNLRNFVRTEMSFKGTQILSQNIDPSARQIELVALGRQILPADIDSAKKRLAQYHLEGYQLHVIQGENTDSLLMKSRVFAGGNSEQMIDRSREVEQLEDRLKSYTQYETVAEEIRPELKALFPMVHSVSIAHVREVTTDTVAPKQLVLAVATVRGRMLPGERSKLQAWIKARAQADSLRLIVEQR